MSGTITNVDMDDVLSSIRRLVSEVGTDMPASNPAAEDRFILTPELRVADMVEQLAKTETATDTSPLVSREIEPPAELTEVLTTAAKAADAQPRSEPIFQSPEFEAMEKAWKEELARVANSREAADADRPGESQSLETQIAELEEAVGKAEDEWEPDGSEPEAKQAPRRHIFEIVANNEDPSTEVFESGPDDGVPVFSHSSVSHPKPYLLSDSVRPVGPEAGNSEAREPNSDAEPDPDDDAPQTDVVGDDDVFLDVEALRTMITEVVREELHGKLGETITRNVRKMMQQEIARAITEQTQDDDR